MATAERTNVYLVNGRLMPVTIKRPSGRGPWPSGPYPTNLLVAALEGGTGDFDIIRKGSLYDDRLVLDCVALHLGHAPENLDTTLWSRLPDAIKSLVSKRVRHAQRSVARQWGMVSNEETLTGVFLGQIETNQQIGDWTVKIDYVEFSKQNKEPGTGADVAIVLDVMDVSGKRAFKSLWIQAKRASRAPEHAATLPRADKQIDAMRRVTDAAYVAVYTPQGVQVTQVNEGNTWRSMDDVILQALNCKEGDPRLAVLADSLNREHVLTVLIDRAKPI